MSDRSPADVLADEFRAGWPADEMRVFGAHRAAYNDTYAPDDLVAALARKYHYLRAERFLAALEAAGYVVVRPGDPWTDTDGRRWAFTRTSVRRINRSTDHMLADLALLPADDVEDPTDG